MNANYKSVFGQFAVFFLLFALALFLPAGTIRWPAGWCFFILFFGFMLWLDLWLLKHNPGLLMERTQLSRANQQGWDKWLFPAMLVFTFAWLVFMALDAVRFHWSHVPAWVQAFGAAVLLSSFYLLFITFRENSYLSPVVHIQEERGQSVISTGPYRYLRHPMYAAILIYSVGTALLLGSWYGVLLGLVFSAILAKRATLEERTLREKLPGYAEYMRRVRYRMIPFIW